MRTLLLASTILLSASSALAQETPSNILTPERVFSSPSLNGPVAKGVSLSPDGQLVAFLRFMDTHARCWLINDLHRHGFAHRGFPILARLARWHPIVRHDG